MKIVLLTVMYLLSLVPAPVAHAVDLLTHGPALGELTADSARLWVRARGEAPIHVELVGPVGTVMVTPPQTPTAEHDRCLQFQFDGLTPETVYLYRFICCEVVGERGRIHTPQADGPGRDEIVFVSCADEEEGTRRAWSRIGEVNPDALVLLGDTPYIDTVELDVQRERYRSFAAVPEFAELVQTLPFFATWDDHDIGLDDTDGNLPGKEASRQAFMEYHPNPSAGGATGGVYTSFRVGSVEVFLLDTRWFAATEPSPVDPEKTTLLGAEQWAWLTAGLERSDAPFKVLACGIVWNDAVGPGKTDHWGTYAHEREALFRFIGEKEISGVVLISGDLHRSRAVQHDSAGRAGYDIIEFTVSPLHDRVVTFPELPHPGLVFESNEPNTFLLLTGDTLGGTEDLSARFETAEGVELRTLRLKMRDLRGRDWE